MNSNKQAWRTCDVQNQNAHHSEGETVSELFVDSVDSTEPLAKKNLLSAFDGYQHCQYAPRKINKKSLGVSSSEQSNSIEYMPDLQGQDPVPIPLQVLQGWGIECGVTPEVITKEALLQDPNNDEN